MVKEYLEPSEVIGLENAADNPRDRLLIHLLFHLGCRVSEVLSLTVDGVDFESGRVSIVHLKSHVFINCRQCGSRLGLRHDFCPKCGAKNEMNPSQRAERRRQRSLPLDTETLTMVRKYIESGSPTVRDGKTYLFGINRHRAWQIVRRCAERAGLPKLINPETGKIHGISPHRLRDAFTVHAVKLNDTGDGLRLLQEHLGHQNFNTTAKYRKVSGVELKEWYLNLWQSQ